MQPDGPAPGSPVWQALLEGTQAGVALLGPDLRYLYVNPALARMNGVEVEAHAGRRIADIVPGVDIDEELFRQVLADGRPRELTSSGQTRAGSAHARRHWRGCCHRVTDTGGRVLGVGLVLLEVSEDQETRRELERTRERLLVLDAAAMRIGSTLEMEPTCQELADLLVEVLADAAMVEVLSSGEQDGHRPPPDGTVRLRRSALSAGPSLRAVAAGLGEPGEYLDCQPGSAIPRCLRTGRPIVLNLLSDDEMSRSAPSTGHVPFYRSAGIHSGLIVPLAARGEQIGTVSMVRAGASPAFDEEDVAVARALAERAAISLDNARRYTREHGIAVELQRALLAVPGAPNPRVDTATRYLPAGADDLVGGDWFDTLALPGGLTLLAMGDVMGHGVGAAVEMSHYRSMLRVGAGEGDAPDRVLRRIDRLLAAGGVERPATCLLGIADPLRGAAWFSSAGHLPPALVAPDGRVSLLDVPPGPPLGADLGGRYETVYQPWPPGHTLLLYTDGLVERRGEDIDTSLARLAGLRLPPEGAPSAEGAVPARAGGGSLDALLARVVHRLAPDAAEDDVALLAARAVPEPGPRR
ncbi:putative magnesium or manganese-dependent protein phosphatase [Actinacidiphila reveromycinica]|uniref:Putative magnesium or manganese-dependent protein phosphatase n=1 Tax=Actinacidiphila reveromycinica TaxID=659352 RepID=A0A7U3UTX6_9ACTN|nr:SpoIIE family protein phosphatase [Streptomyces sp. SN-593]BBA98583.1 putative magnesium or manganese-dependent protein phosphatase [Streptomyces sp. SN-593]